MGPRVFLVAMCTLIAACVDVSQPYSCSRDAQCVTSEQSGRCEAESFCSFPDTNCASGRRFGALSGALADRCVGDAVDGGTDGGCVGCVSGGPHNYVFVT